MLRQRGPFVSGPFASDCLAHLRRGRSGCRPHERSGSGWIGRLRWGDVPLRLWVAGCTQFKAESPARPAQDPGVTDRRWVGTVVAAALLLGSACSTSGDDLTGGGSVSDTQSGGGSSEVGARLGTGSPADVGTDPSVPRTTAPPRGAGRSPEPDRAPRPPQGEFRYRGGGDSERKVVFGELTSEPAGWAVRVTDGGFPQTQLWTSKETTLVTEARGGATCRFDPPLLIRSALRPGSEWTADSTCRLGNSDSYMTRSIRARVMEETSVPVMGASRKGWRISESIRTVVAPRPPTGMSVVTTQTYETVDEVTQTSVFSEELKVVVTVQGHRRFTNPDGSVHDGDFHYELVGVPA